MKGKIELCKIEVVNSIATILKSVKIRFKQYNKE